MEQTKKLSDKDIEIQELRMAFHAFGCHLSGCEIATNVNAQCTCGYYNFRIATPSYSPSKRRAFLKKLREKKFKTALEAYGKGE